MNSHTRSTLLKILAIAYAVFILVGGQLAAYDSDSLGYPWPLVAATSITYLALAIGIAAVAFRWHPAWIRKHWNKVFPFCVADLVLGVLMDALVPKDYSLLTDGFWWILGTALVMALLFPAFYVNFRLAYHHAG